jgi:hypothetical protein
MVRRKSEKSVNGDHLIGGRGKCTGLTRTNRERHSTSVVLELLACEVQHLNPTLLRRSRAKTGLLDHGPGQSGP